jgi:uncharacterized RDD family membrane protein YckC
MIDKGIRIANFIIDILIIVFAWLLSNLILYVIGFDSFSSILFYLIYFCYYFFFEFLAGKTPGKMLTRTVVKTFGGNKPSTKRILIRSLLRLIPYDYFSFLFGGIGLHDELSKTTVVKEDKNQRFEIETI